MSYVCVLNNQKQPLNPCHPAAARQLLTQGKAAVFRRFPFVIILKEECHHKIEPLRLKIDPGSKVTGLALVHDGTGHVVFAAEINHRGSYIHNELTARRSIRRSRRSRNTRYRAARFNNRKRASGRLPPSLESRIENTLTWVKRLMRYCPINAISQELVRFDMQLLENPDIEGIQYQQGTLAGYEVREYLLELHNRTCVYCNADNIPLEIDHILPVSRGGSNRISNLTLACRPCNQAKGNKTAQEFGFADIQLRTKKSLKDAAAVNTTRLKLYQRLAEFKVPVETSTGARTKFNRIQYNVPKAHWIDAACVGEISRLNIKHIHPLIITATGHGIRQMCKVDAYGFPRTVAKSGKKFFGYQTGDIVKAVVTKGKKIGTYVGKVAVRASGSFNITTKDKTIQGINYAFCKPIHASDGYRYN